MRTTARSRPDPFSIGVRSSRSRPSGTAGDVCHLRLAHDTTEQETAGLVEEKPGRAEFWVESLEYRGEVRFVRDRVEGQAAGVVLRGIRGIGVPRPRPRSRPTSKSGSSARSRSPTTRSHHRWFHTHTHTEGSGWEAGVDRGPRMRHGTVIRIAAPDDLDLRVDFPATRATTDRERAALAERETLLTAVSTRYGWSPETWPSSGSARHESAGLGADDNVALRT